MSAPKRVETFVETTRVSNWTSYSISLAIYPAVPSFAVMELIPWKVPVKVGGTVVCMRTLTASKGQRPISAKNSAEAEAVR